MSSEPLVSHAKAMPAKRSERAMGPRMASNNSKYYNKYYNNLRGSTSGTRLVWLI